MSNYQNIGNLHLWLRTMTHNAVNRDNNKENKDVMFKNQRKFDYILLYLYL